MHGTIDSLFRVEWRPLAELDAIVTDWRDLAGRAIEPNVFYEPSFAQAAAPVFGRDAGAGLVWSRAMPPRLVGLFPARIERRRYGITLPVLVGWTHPYAPLGTPLVDRDAGETVIAAWLDHVAGDPQLPDVMLLPSLPTDGALAQAIDAVVARRGAPSASFARHRRALLLPADDRTSYLDLAVGHKKRKELRRQRKRLGDGGVTIVNALESVWLVLQNEMLKQEVKNISQEVANGTSLTNALHNSTLFPEASISMIAVGEESGDLQRGLYKLAEYYERQTQQSVKRITSLIEPVLILVLGLVVGFIFVAMLLPVLRMNLMIK